MNAGARILYLFLVLSTGGCRSLVDPGAERSPEPENVVTGRVVVSETIPVGFAQVTVSNVAYALPPHRVIQSATISPSGSFAVAVPRDLDGYFDVVVEFSTPYGARSWLFLGEVAGSHPLELDLDLVALTGRIEVPEELRPFEFVNGVLALDRIDQRPAGAIPYIRTWTVPVDADGHVEDLVPRGPWGADLRADASGPIARLDVLVDPAYVFGSIELMLDLTPVTLDVRLPEAWPAGFSTALDMISNQGDLVVQDVTWVAEGIEIWASGQWVRPRPSWPAGLATAYESVGPSTAGAWTDVRRHSRLELVLPPRILDLRVQLGGEPVAAASVRVREGGSSKVHLTGADGRLRYLCENGAKHLEIRSGSITVTRTVVVTGDTELIVDLALEQD